MVKAVPVLSRLAASTADLRSSNVPITLSVASNNWTENSFMGLSSWLF